MDEGRDKHPAFDRPRLDLEDEQTIRTGALRSISDKADR